MGMLPRLKNSELAELSDPNVNGEKFQPEYRNPTKATAPREFAQAGSDVDMLTGGYIVTEAKPKGTGFDARQVLEDNDLDPDEWRVTSYRKGKWQLYDGEWRESFRLAVAPIPPSMRSFFVDVPLDAWIKKQKRVPKIAPTAEESAFGLVVCYADPQWGGTGSGGGSNETALRIQDIMEQVDEWIAELKKRPAYKGMLEHAALIDAGDGTEGFQNVASQAQTNDLNITSQFRAYRRSQFKYADLLARNFKSVDVAIAGSNHCRVRDGKDSVSEAQDDWGVEATVVNADIMRTNPTYDHVKFYVPELHSADVTFNFVGWLLGVTHGHEARQANNIGPWLTKQKSTDQAIGFSEILFYGHFHHYVKRAIGSVLKEFIMNKILRKRRVTRWAIGLPTMDNGSDWFTAFSGEQSLPGLYCCVIGPTGIVEEKIFEPRVGRPDQREAE
jgi:hypothetical protein